MEKVKTETNVVKKKVGWKLLIGRVLQVIWGVIGGFLLVVLMSKTLPQVEKLLTLKAAQIWPSAYDPVARFAVDMNWETNTIDMDASMSKAFGDGVKQYIWRIDDGTSLIGDSKLTHKFNNPGYYLVQLSVVDANQQSDVASCQIMIPPTEVEKIETQQLVTIKSESSVVTNTEWAPKGNFYNYSKLSSKRTYADMKSRYVSSDCGLSNRGYNINDTANNLSLRNSTIRKIVASLVINISELIVLVVVFVSIGKLIDRKMVKVKKVS